jgi:hypothetical protein
MDKDRGPALDPAQSQAAYSACLHRRSAQRTIEPFALRDANRALAALRSGELRGAAILVPSSHDGSRHEPS